MEQTPSQAIGHAAHETAHLGVAANPSGRSGDVQFHDQTQLLERRQKLLVFCLLSLNQCISFIDQNGICVLLPVIAKEFHAEESISWAGTSALVANAVSQLLYGRLSDLFGRKAILVAALLLLSLSCLAVGLAVNAPMLFFFRALAGVANGGVSAMTQNTVSDVCTLEERGKWVGILGTMVGVGTALGPLIGSAFNVYWTWRGLFYLLAVLSAAAAVLSYVHLPTNMPKRGFHQTIKKLDFGGTITSAAAVTLLLVAIMQGGHDDTPWQSATIISMFVVGGLLFALFIWIEAKWAELPIMPLAMLRNPSVAAMIAQTFLFGAAFYSEIYFLPFYFQNVRKATPLMSSVYMLPMVASQALFSFLSGQYVSRMKRYGEVLHVGFFCWTVGAALLIVADEDLSIGWTSLFLGILGMGVGCTFNTNQTALQAHCSKENRAVISSVRTFTRSSGGAIGLGVSSAVMRVVVHSKTPPHLSAVAKSTFAVPELAGYSQADRSTILAVFHVGSRAVFILCVPLTALCALLLFLVKDNGTTREQDKLGPKEMQDDEGAGVLDFRANSVTEAPESDTTSASHVRSL